MSTAKLSPNYKFNLPSLTDAADITDLSKNWEQADTLFKHPKPRRIEFETSEGEDGGFIDFHYGGSTKDYTSRIIESAEGVLTVNGSKMSLEGDLTVKGGHKVYSTYNKPTADEVGALPDKTVPIEKGGTGATTLEEVRTNLGIADIEKIVNSERVEFTPLDDAGNGGYIDFHYNNDQTNDYTSRIIESSKGVLTVNANKLSLEGDITVHEGHKVYSTYNKPTAAEVGALPNTTVPINKGGTGATTAAQALVNLGIENKPSGTFTGTNASSIRSISIGGTSDFLMVTRANSTAMPFLVIVNRTGAVYFGLDTSNYAKVSYDDNTTYYDGVLTINTSSVLNNSSYGTFSYQVV